MSSEHHLAPDADFVVFAFLQAAEIAVRRVDETAAGDFLVLVDEREVDVLAWMSGDAGVVVLVLEIRVDVVTRLGGVAAREDAPRRREIPGCPRGVTIRLVRVR